MDERIRKALLGNKEAQEECTNKGIILPCPKCYSEMFVESSYIESNPNGYEYRVTFKCSNLMCGLSFTGTQVKRNDGIVLMQDKSPLAQWNDRPAPPVGRCENCKHWVDWGVCGRPDNGWDAPPMKADDFCSHFEAKVKEYD